MAKKSTSKGKKPAPLPELLQKAIDDTIASLKKPIPPGEGAEAAAAYRKILLSDADRRESIARWRWRQLIEQTDPDCQRARSEFWRLVREAYDQSSAELTEAGFQPPGDDIQKWIRLAKVIEADPEFTNLGELAEAALTWAEREAMRERIRQRVSAESGDDDENWSEADRPSQFIKKVKLGKTTFYAYLKNGTIRHRPAGKGFIQVWLSDYRKFLK
jgi:hypothetical protein